MNSSRIAAVALALACLSVAALPVHPAPRPARTLTVFAAASLSEAFKDAGRQFERGHPDVAVRFNFAGSQQLAVQLEQGASADLVATADERTLDSLQAHGLLAGAPVVFAHNHLVVIVPRTNPARIARLQDLARRGVRLVIAADAVPAGHYARQMLANLSRQPGFATGFARQALANVVSEEENVRAVVGKVQLAEADAGVVYRSDLSASLTRYVRAFEIPIAANVVAIYPVAVLREAREQAAAAQFIELLRSREGQALLVRRGFLPAGAR